MVIAETYRNLASIGKTKTSGLRRLLLAFGLVEFPTLEHLSCRFLVVYPLLDPVVEPFPAMRFVPSILVPATRTLANVVHNDP